MINYNNNFFPDTTGDRPLGHTSKKDKSIAKQQMKKDIKMEPSAGGEVVMGAEDWPLLLKVCECSC